MHFPTEYSELKSAYQKKGEVAATVGEGVGFFVTGAFVGSDVGSDPQQSPRDSHACCHPPPHAVLRGSNPTWLHNLSKVGIAAVNLHTIVTSDCCRSMMGA